MNLGKVCVSSFGESISEKKAMLLSRPNSNLQHFHLSNSKPQILIYNVYGSEELNLLQIKMWEMLF